MKRNVVVVGMGILLFLSGCGDETGSTSSSGVLSIGEVSLIEASKTDADSETVEATYNRSDLEASETFMLVPFLLDSLDGEVIGYTQRSATYSQTSVAKSQRVFSVENDIRKNAENVLRDLGPFQASKKSTSTLVSPKAALAEGNELIFNFSRDGSRAEKQITSIVKKIGTHSVILLDKADIQEDDAALTKKIDSLFDALEDILLPRWQTLFKMTDTETTIFANISSSAVIDNKIAILLTSRMDRESEVVMFNYLDLWEYNAGTNPLSNQQFVFYSALPSDTITEDRLLSGIGHQLQHLTNHVEKTLMPYRRAEVKTPQFEVQSLDEGLSLLSEDILGYG